MEPIEPDEVLKPILFTPAERDLLLGLNDIDPEIEKRFRLAVLRGDELIVPLNAYDLDGLLGSIATVANHTDNKKLRKVMDELFVRISDILDREFPQADADAGAKTAVEAANNTALDDFCGLSPDQMHKLIYKPFGPDSPVRYCTDVENDTLDQIPFLRLAEELLHIIEREGYVKLTVKLGALPRNMIQELYSKKVITEEFVESGAVKLLNESDSTVLVVLHEITVLSRLVKVNRGKMSLSKDGRRLLEYGHRPELFHHLFQTFTLSYDWASTDRYADFPIAQLGWGFSIFLLLRFGQEPRPVSYYAEKYLKAFPAMLKYMRPIGYKSPSIDFKDCYETRTYQRFLEWFGMIRYISGRSFFERDKAIIARTDVLTKVFLLR